MRLEGVVKALDTRYGSGATVHIKDGGLGFSSDRPFELEFSVTTAPEDLERWRVGRKVVVEVTAREDADADAATAGS